jgi:hypothetical protein
MFVESDGYCYGNGMLTLFGGMGQYLIHKAYFKFYSRYEHHNEC